MYKSRFKKQNQLISKPKFKVSETKDNKKLIVKRKFREEETSHKETIMQLADQITKYIEKKKDNPNGVINDIAMGLFLGFSEFYAHDGDSDSNGINMLSKVIEKVKILSKNFDDLIPEKEDDFDLDSAADEILGSEEEDDENESEEESNEEESNEDEEIIDEEEIEDEEKETNKKQESFKRKIYNESSPYISKFFDNDSDISEYK